MKSFFGLTLLVVILVALLVSGCAPAVTPSAPAASSQPTGAPGAAPTSAPASSAPTAAPKATSGSAAKPIELRFSHHNPPTGRTTVKLLNPWAKKVEEATQGRVKITMYPAESLAKSMENIEAVNSGLADMAWLNMGNWTGRFPLTEVMNLPFINILSGNLNGKPEPSAALNSLIVQQIYEKFPEVQSEWAQMKLLFLHTSEPYFLATTKKPVRNMNDIKGLKLRTFGKYPTELYKNLGASPLLLAMPEVYDAAQKGVIDGMGAPWAAVATYKLFEVFRNWTDVGTDVALFAVVMNKDSWNNLPKDIQAQVMSVSGLYGAQFAGEEGFGDDVKAETLAAAEKAGKAMEKVSLDPGEYEKWRDTAGKPLWDKWVKDNKGPTQQILDETLKLIAKYKN